MKSYLLIHQKNQFKGTVSVISSDLPRFTRVPFKPLTDDQGHTTSAFCVQKFESEYSATSRKWMFIFCHFQKVNVYILPLLESECLYFLIIVKQSVQQL